MRDIQVILEELRMVRLLTITAYKRLADILPDAEKVGWKPRDPKAPDVTLLILALGAQNAPMETYDVIMGVIENDLMVTRCLVELAKALRERA